MTLLWLLLAASLGLAGEDVDIDAAETDPAEDAAPAPKPEAPAPTPVAPAAVAAATTTGLLPVRLRHPHGRFVTRSAWGAWDGHTLHRDVSGVRGIWEPKRIRRRQRQPQRGRR